MGTQLGTMTADEIVELARRYTLYDWAKATPIAVDHAEGVYFTDTDGTPYLHLNSQVNRFLLDSGVFTMIRWNHLMTNPPLCINEEQLGEAFDVVDKALEIADRAMEK